MNGKNAAFSAMRKVEVNIHIATKPETVIRAFTDPDMLRGWWGVERSFVEPHKGGTYLVAWEVSEKGFRYITSGVITRYTSDSLLEISNLTYLNPERPILGGLGLLVRAKPGKNGGAEVYLCQGEYFDAGHDEHWDWYYDAVEKAWPAVMQTLKGYLEEGFGG